MQFNERPMLVTVGDNSLIQVEIPQNSKSVVIKPLQQAGETNLFVFTVSQRFNYKVVITNQSNVDYVVDTKESTPDIIKQGKTISLDEVLYLAKNYSELKDLRAVNQRKLIQKDLYYSYAYPRVKVDFLESFINKKPDYLIIHIVIHNITNLPFMLDEKNTSIVIHDQKFNPQYILFDKHMLKSNGQTDGWLVLENTYISMDNKFECKIGIEDIG